MVKKKVIVLGGGIIGLSTAYYLIQEGHEVTIIAVSYTHLTLPTTPYV